MAGEVLLWRVYRNDREVLLWWFGVVMAGSRE